MADDHDDAQRTEEPTQKKLDDAREQGDVPRSQDIVLLATLSAATIAIVAWGNQAASGFMSRFTVLLASPEAVDASGGGLLALSWHIGIALGLILGMPFALMLAAAIGGHLIQSPLLFSAKKIAPSFSKLSPMQGFSRLFSREALINFAKGLLKVICVGVAVVYAVWPDHNALMDMISADPRAGGAAAYVLITKMLGPVLGVVAAFAVIDWFWQRLSFMRRMRMSKQDIRDELKDAEGDPTIKMKLRQIRMERSRRRMMAAVPGATVVVTNPTHYAVALKYESGEMAAPVCVAKGVDLMALRIRDLARESGVPVIENPPLARSLYASVAVDAAIPAEHFKAVAQIIGFIMRQRLRS